MTLPSGPFLELGYYLAGSTDQAALELLVRSMLATGARFVGTAVCSRGSGQNLTLDVLRDLTDADLWRLCADENAWVTQVVMEQPGISPASTSVIAAQLDPDPKSDKADPSRVAIWIDGGVFSRPFIDREPPSARRVAVRSIQLFRLLIPSLRPAYGAITLAHPLPSPSEIARGSGWDQFGTFYVAADYIGAKWIDRLAEEAAGVWRENFPTGLAASTWDLVNPPKRRGSSTGFGHLSRSVAEAIASRAMRTR